jgi:curved DNA-binding protein CbpA
MSDRAPVDLPPELRGYLDAIAARLESIDHYELLELTRDAEPRAIKQAYFRLAQLLHPDRFFGRPLGEYAAVLKQVFSQVTRAYEELSSAPRRAAYDATLGPPAISSPVRAPVPAPRAARPSPAPPPDADSREQAMNALKRRFLDAREAARRHAEDGARARAAGDVVSAAQAYRAALRLHPDDAALAAALEEVQREGASRVADSRRKQAELEERYGHWAEAAASWRKVVEACPADAEARARLAQAIERSRGVRPL